MSVSRLHDDGLRRCPWPGEDPLYVAYHDHEWGVPEYDDRALFEKLMLDGFQAGLSWITILRKRDNFRKAFDNFEPEKIARYNARKVDALMNDAGIVRNRAKIEGAVEQRQGLSRHHGEGPGFSKLLWDFVDGKPVRSTRSRPRDSVPAETPVSRADVEGTRGARIQVRRPDHRLCLHAGDRHGQRPSRRAAIATRRALQRASRPKQASNDDAPKTAASHAPGSACCRAAGSTCSTPRRSISRSRTSPMGSRASRAGTARRRARISFPSRSTRCWSRPCCGRRHRASTSACGWRRCCTMRRNMSSAT